MRSFVERTRAKMGDLHSQVTTGVTRMREQMGHRSNEDLSSEVETPLASELGSTGNLPPEEAIAKLESQNQALWAKLHAAANVQKENVALHAELDSLKDKLVSVSTDADDQVKRIQESNDALKERLRTLASECEHNEAILKEKSELLAQIEDLKFQVIMAKSDASMEHQGKALDHEQLINELRKSNKNLVIKLEHTKLNEQRLCKEVEQLRATMKGTENDSGPSGTSGSLDGDARSNTEEQEICSADEDPIGGDLRKKCKDLEIQCSELEALSGDLNKKVEELEAAKADLLTTSGLLEERLMVCERALTESEESRSYLTSIVEDLEKQLDACSPEQVIGLRSMIERLESDNSHLQADMEVLSLQLRGASAPSRHLEKNPPARPLSDEEEDESYCQESVVSDELRDGAGMVSGGEPSEPLVDLSHDIVNEMANVGDHAKIELSLSSVQYAGLLSIVQKAVRQVEAAKSHPESSPDTFTLLDQTLSRSLSITNHHSRAPSSAMDERIGSVDGMIEEKRREVVGLQDIFMKLKEQVKGQKTLSVCQEVQLEYLMQQLSSPEKVIKLSWEVEGLRKSVEDSRREVEALKEQSEQQQRELTIQWQSKQQALAETQAHHHQVSSVSQQIEHLKQANENLQSERAEVERELEEVREELEDLRAVVGRIHASKAQHGDKSLAIMELLSSAGVSGKDAESCSVQILTAIAEAEEEHMDVVPSSLAGEMSDLLASKAEMEKELESLQADLKLSESIKARLESTIQSLQAEVSLAKNALSASQEKHAAELDCLGKQLEAAKASAAAEIADLQQLQQSLEGGMLRSKNHVQELTNKLEEASTANASMVLQLRNEQQAHEHTKGQLVAIDSLLSEERQAAKEALESSLAESAAASSRIEETIRDLQAERDNMTAELGAWKIKASELGEEADQSDALRKEVEHLTEQLSLKEAMWESERRKSDGLTAEKSMALNELATLQLVVGRLEDNLTNSKAEISRLNDLLDTERSQYSAAARSWEEELESLAQNIAQRDSWPVSVKRLVELCERSATEAVQIAERSRQEELEQEVEDAMDRLEAAEVDYSRRNAEMESERASALQRMSYLEEEMRERESKLQEKLQASEELFSSEKAHLEEEVAILRDGLAAAKEEAEDAEQQLSVMLEDKTNQLVAMQEKARVMMMEKDEEIQKLKLHSWSQDNLQGHAPSNNIAGEIPEHIALANSTGTKDDRKSGEPSGYQDSFPDAKENESSVKALKAELQRTREQVQSLELEMQDSERTHALRDKANDILKEEIAELRRENSRDGLDVNYLKNILVSAFEKGTLPNDSPMVEVLARLLHFSPKEVERIKNSAPVHNRTASRSLFPVWGR